jgi:hypothetical protein
MENFKIIEEKLKNINERLQKKNSEKYINEMSEILSSKEKFKLKYFNTNLLPYNNITKQQYSENFSSVGKKEEIKEEEEEDGLFSEELDSENYEIDSENETKEELNIKSIIDHEYIKNYKKGK